MTSFFSMQKTIDTDLPERNMGQELCDKFLVTSLYFAQLAYFSTPYIYARLAQAGAEVISIYNRNGVQAIFAEFNTFAVISFRGREVDHWCDIKPDLQFWKIDFNKHKVHSGFAKSLLHVSPRLESDLLDLGPNKRILYTGHSLGGALAMLMALQWKPTDICTFGSPRVFHRPGSKRYFNGINIIRFYARNDFVPNLPPAFIGYEHIGKSIQIPGRNTKWDSHRLITYLRGVVRYEKQATKYGCMHM